MSKPKSAKVDVAEGLYIMKCVTVADIGTQTIKKFDNPEEEEEKKQIILVMELVEESTKDKPVTLSKWATNSANAKSFGGKMAKAMGLSSSFDWKDCLGKYFQGQVVHTESGNAKIDSMVPIKKGSKPPKGFINDYKSLFLDDEYSREDFEAMPEFIQNAALKSPEFEAVDAKTKKKSGGKKK